MKRRLIALVIWLGSILQNSASFSQAFPNLYSVTGNAESVSPISTEESKAFQTDLFTGVALYNVAIDVPNGTGGVQPSISLSYQSTPSNSWSGVGWTIGFGSIERSTKHGVPEYDSDDTYMLNGQELVSCPVHNWWHTNIESFSKIVRTMDEWTVTSTGGTKTYYGRRSNSRITGPSGLAKWLLDKVEDVHGNYFEIEYDKTIDDGFAYPKLITYTKNDVASTPLTKFRTVEFVLENRPDVIMNYRRGFLEKISKRLREVIVRVDGNLVRKYVFNYEVSSGSDKSLLKTIIQYGNDGATSLPPTTFEYGYNRNKGFSLSPDWAIPIPLTFSNGADNGARIIDLNGDGLVDIIKSREGSNQRVFINSGTQWVEDNVNWRLPSGIWFATSRNQDNGVRLADVNGDGLVDILKYKEGAAGPKAYLNNGRGWGIDDSNWHPPSGMYFTASSGEDKGVRLLDVNGDSKIDLLKYIEGSTPKTYLSNGTTWELKPKWDSPTPFIFSNGKDKGVRHTDLNSDGLIDALKGFPEVYKLTFLNSGIGWTSDMSQWHVSEEFTASGGTDRGVRMVDVNNDGQVDILKYLDGSVSKAYINTTHGWQEDNTWASPEPFIFSNGTGKGVQFGDVNGDGLVDILKYIDGSTSKLYLNQGSGDVDLLLKIRNPIGGEIEIEYLRSAKRPNTSLPFALQTVHKVTKKYGPGNNSTTSYEYSGGLYDFAAKEFRGFAKVTVTDPEGNVTTQEFHQDEFRKGKPFASSLIDNAGRKHTENSFQWDLSGSCPGARAVLLREEQSILYNPTTGRKARSGIRYEEYDEFGNLKLKRYLGDLDQAGDEYERHTKYAYNISKWIVCLPTDIFITNASGTKVQETWYNYDNLAIGKVKKGNLTKTEYWNDHGDNPVVTRTFDDFGNLATETDAEANENGRGPTKNIEYDSVYHTFPHIFTDAKGFKVEFIYAPEFGVWTTLKNDNGENFYKRYDGFGRIKQLVGPYDLSSPFGAVTYDYLDYGNVGNQRIRFSRTEKYGKSDVLWNEDYFDGFGRTIKRVAEGISGNNLYEEIEYNSRGLQESLSLPHLVQAASQRLKYKYDPLGRITFITLPSGAQIEYKYNLRTTSVYDPEGKVRTYTKDVYNRGIEIREKNGDEEYVTRYYYDFLDNLRKVIDQKGNKIVVDYSSLGRKISISDPDLGNWTYEYDQNGNLKKQIDNKGQKLEFVYDELNRITMKKYPNESVEEYFYDRYPNYNKRLERNLIGRLAMVKENDITTTYHYDRIGRIIWTDRKIDGVWYSLGSEYDALNRVTKAIYPDGEEVIIDYNERGALKSVIGTSRYVKNIDYWPIGQFKQITYGNDTKTNYSYDSQTLYLDTLTTVNNAGNLLQKFAYAFDRTGNVDLITDFVNTGTQTFEYDDLYRVTKAIGNYGTLSYTYSATGNIETNNGENYYYEGNQPHAVTRTDNGLKLEYDLNGNLKIKGNEEYEYDFNNRLKSVFRRSNDGSRKLLAEFKYDYQGQRIKIKTDSKSIIYLSELAEVEGNKITKHYFAGPRLVATKVEKDFKLVKQSSSVGIFTPVNSHIFFGFLIPLIFVLFYKLHFSFWLILKELSVKKIIACILIITLLGHLSTCYAPPQTKISTSTIKLIFYHGDHLGSTNLVTDIAGNLVRYYEYYPFGKENIDRGGEDINHRYTSQRFDSETGLYYYGSRYYDPDLGRFIQPDPIIPKFHDPQSFNRYSYVINNPLKYLDPNGTNPILVGILVGAVIGAMVSGTVYTLTAGTNFSLGGLGRAMAFGALGGAMSGLFGGVGGLVGGGSLMANIGFSVLGNTVTYTAASIARGNEFTIQEFLGAYAVGAIGGFIPGYTGYGVGFWKNAALEIGYKALTGALTGAISGGVGALISGEDNIQGVLTGAWFGLIGGVVSGALNVVAFGAAFQPSENTRERLSNMEADMTHGFGSYRPVYRTGGLVSSLFNTNIALGRNILVPDNQDSWVTLHETAHYIQQLYKGYGEFLAQGAYENWFLDNPSVGTQESEASAMATMHDR